MPSKVCSICGFEAVSNSKLIRHESTHLKCRPCRLSFATTSEASEHMADCGKWNQSKKCSLCSVQGISNEEIEEHLVQHHKIKLKEATYEFQNKKEFADWKTRVESSQKSLFVRRGKNVLSDRTTLYLVCHRSGKPRVRTRLGQQKTISSNKINAYCPARMRVTHYSDGRVTVIFVKTHVGHYYDLNRAPLDRRAKMTDIPLDDILNTERGDLIKSEKAVELVEPSRLNLLSRKDIHNITRDFNVKRIVTRDENEADNIESWIHTNEKCSTFVRYYKFRGTLDPAYPHLGKEDFVLVLMNDTQLTMLQNFGSDVVCMDRTLSTNTCPFELTTVLVLDENREGFPCAFLLSNRSNSDIITVFLRVVSIFSGRVNCNIFITGLTDTYYDSWVESMGVPNRHLYCSHHVVRDWRENIRKIKGSAQCKVDVNERLTIVHREVDEKIFSKTFPLLIKDLINDDDSKEFGEYLLENYTMNADRWAHCRRPNGVLNTNVHLDWVKGMTKYELLKKRKLKRVEECLIVLTRYLRDKCHEISSKLLKKESSTSDFEHSVKLET